MAKRERLRVGDWCWNIRESALDLSPGWLIEIVEIMEEPYGIRGRAVMIDGDYNKYGYYFADTDLELAYRADA